MQTIELRATAPFEQFPAEVMEVQSLSCLDNGAMPLDDALATLVQAVRQSGLEGGMDALGTLLAYMENLEKKQTAHARNESWITLSNPLTMSV
ncbi:MAG TPA: hypothetical protein VFV43_08325 [Limnobacter sp.]|nr:hypothetical protein [Limnobacter sp.]